MAAGTIDEYAKALGDWRGEVVGELDVGAGVVVAAQSVPTWLGPL